MRNTFKRLKGYALIFITFCDSLRAHANHKLNSNFVSSSIPRLLLVAMARPLAPSFSMASHHLFQHPSHFLFALVVFFSMFSLLIFLCASHKSKKSHEKKEEAITNSKSKDVKFIAKLNSKISSKALAMAKMVSWRKMEAGEEDLKDDDDHSDDAVWRKSIIMGERCAPLNFSGKIDYDSEGNLQPESPDRNH
ncbi:hypothetical protein CerSpe_117320 [Prunus speciosa]